ncbi:MAG: VWA domain-containing protein [Crocinitomicaceae bacterium]|nr:VWA domain-containing protein [Crocinitomicaceae bacterium]
MKRFFLIVVIFISTIAYGQEQLTRILFILDASNSMNNLWDAKETRFAAAKRILSKSVTDLEGVENLEIALRVYGHQSEVTATYQDCSDTKLEIPFGKNNHESIKNRIKTIQAKGTTPIARSLEAAAEDFPDNKSRNVIILITDGLEACDNDPCVIARKLHEKGVNVKPFVIGVGMDLSYLEKFRCIGEYADAETPESFEKVLQNIVSKALVNTTVQINLNNTAKQPKETDVTLFIYKAGTKELKYTFTHTLNSAGLPDTLVLDPAIEYDMIVNTLPNRVLKNIKLKRNVHNTIIVDAPQGYIQTRVIHGNRQYVIPTRVMENGNPSTLNVQQVDEVDKYIVGKYDLEILTLPRTYMTIDVTQSSVTKVDIVAPGQFSYKASSAITGQVFTVNGDGTYTWVCNLDDKPTQGNYNLQPGNYKVVYRFKKIKSTMYTVEKEFRIYSNKITSLNF